MENLIFIALEAHHAPRNHHRRYEIAVGRDLLDEWSVTVRYGRVGGGCREERFGGSDVQGLRQVVHERLKRRLSAERRLNCAYRVVAIRHERGMDREWLPEQLLARF
ncbi:MAG: WGR domain-containing protein [Phycisphaerales bacterium]|nr:WGR domain-containing protein [Phycisphaerales bacterium]